MKRAIFVVAIVGLLSLASYGSSITYSAILSGTAESPPNASPGTGFTLVTYDNFAHTLSVFITFSGLLGNTTASHIHCCSLPTAMVATQTPNFSGFPLGVMSGSYSSPTFDLTQASSWNGAFITANGGTTASAEAAFAAGLASGNAYVNIHSQSVPAGEIRGFLQPVPEPTSVLLLSSGVLGILGRWKKKIAH